jgi:predicted Zn-dependent protease
MRALTLRLALASAMAIGLASPLLAMGTQPPDDASATACKEADKTKCAQKPADKSKNAPAKLDCKGADKAKCTKQQQGFLDQYKAAVALIEAGKYDDALVAMRALDDGSSADVINYIGYINRKQGHMAEAQMYYEAALHMQPNHRGALEYYGEWWCMMGNVTKARENLATIKTIYGSDTKEYSALAKMIDDTVAAQKS